MFYGCKVQLAMAPTTKLSVNLMFFVFVFVLIVV